ncbi:MULTISPECIES: TonB-dependent receptor plug domain-containing protein [unclassified Sphingobium]|uniref:TonB-dependent receptor plug domain-containing protein n=1 Tax=unclassified Sphingobium TaxID=2611147 RepID=UPI002224AB60|nr:MULTISPECIES: TonB-dependent receptor [unclassified Sphingobium]MCW2413246.1 outer membrane receptor protein involved in Fe transport [Sphingobium sp. B8D3D]MCW2414456.1 outer membrane receptor protein involved in Fe transport [Sphingobium sp. B8D3A]
MKKTTSQTLLKLAAAPAVLGLAMLSSAAHAQEPQNADGAEDGEVIIVTGSRIARPEFSFPNPVQAVTAAQIEQRGNVNLTDFLVTSPALLGSRSNIDVAGSNLPNAGLVGVNNLDLRNLGPNRTLVLVDGRRHVAGYPGTAAVDINTIPTDLVESVDVLTGGASAIYGADGVSGVVNFIMKKDFDGLRLRAQSGISQRGDAGDRFVAATFGKNFADSRGNITLSYEFNETDRFSQRQRLNYGKTGPSWALVRNPADGTPGTSADDPNVPDRILLTDLRWADSSIGGAVDVNGDFTPDFTGEGGVYDLGSYVPGTSFTVGGSSTPRESYYGDFTPYNRRHIANAMARFEVSPAFEVYLEGKYVRSKAYTLSQPSYDFYTKLYEDNPYLPAAWVSAIQAANAAGDCDDDETPGFEECSIRISRDNFDFGIRRYELERELFRTVIGARGDLGSNLRYDISYVFGQSTQTATNRNDRISDRYYAALDAVSDGNGGVTCRINLPGQTEIQSDSYNNTVYAGVPLTFQPGQCVPINLLGYGTPSQQALDFVTVDHSTWSRLRQHVVTAALSGDTGGFFELPGGPVGFAVGAEYRKESSVFIPSDYQLNGYLIDSGFARIDRGSFDVKEVFGEVNLPLLSRVPGAYELSLGGAIRYSDYSTIGGTTTWNVNGSYSPVRDVTFRGTYSQAVRAPNITELFAGGSGTYEFITDPCGIDRVAEGTQYRAANCATALAAVGVNPSTFNPADDATSPQNSSILGFQGGNPTLQEETAKTWTAGVVFRPTFVPGLTITADWYSIRLKQAINYATAQDVVDLCYDQPDLDNIYCDVIARKASGAGQGYISTFTVIPENVASYETSGLDFVVDYRFVPEGDVGTFNFRVTGNVLNKLQFVPSAGADLENELHNWEYPAPKYTANFDLTWQKGPFTLNYGLEWWSKTRRVTLKQEQANPDYAPAEYIWYNRKWEHNIYASYNVDDRFDIYGGINNLGDRKPDDGGVAYPISAVGRSFYVGVKAKLF